MTVKYFKTIYADDKDQVPRGLERRTKWRDRHDIHKGEQSLCLISTKPNFLVSVCPNLTQTSLILGFLNFRKARIVHPNKDPMARRQYVARQIGNRMQRESGRGDRGKKGGRDAEREER